MHSQALYEFTVYIQLKVQVFHAELFIKSQSSVSVSQRIPVSIPTAHVGHVGSMSGCLKFPAMQVPITAGCTGNAAEIASLNMD